MEIELRHARVVASVAAAGSISKAALRLGLPQPSLTAQLRRIEQALGGDLFVRSNSGITPTPLGERLIPMFADLAHRADTVLAIAASLTSGVLRLGVEWTGDALPTRLRDSLPHWEIRTEPLNPATGVGDLCAATAALLPVVPAIAPLRLPEPGLAGELLVREPLCVALPPGGSTRDLTALAWVAHAPEHWLAPIEKHVFARLRQAPVIARTVRRHADAVALVAEDGLAAVTTPVGVDRPVTVAPLAAMPQVDLMLLWRKGSLDAAARTRLVATLRDSHREHAAEFPRPGPYR